MGYPILPKKIRIMVIANKLLLLVIEPILPPLPSAKISNPAPLNDDIE